MTYIELTVICQLFIAIFTSDIFRFLLFNFYKSDKKKVSFIYFSNFRYI